MSAVIKKKTQEKVGHSKNSGAWGHKGHGGMHEQRPAHRVRRVDPVILGVS